MASITLQGEEIHTNGELPRVGTQAPDFRLVAQDLSDQSLADFEDKKKVLNIVPSLDTSVCAISTRRFDQFGREREDIVVLVVSADLPFAQKRFTDGEGLRGVTTLSMMRNRNFAKDYGVLIEDGPLEGITARAVVVLDACDQVIYTELVPEIGQEPDYEKAMAAI